MFRDMARKTAVDQKAKTYWTDYFGDFGRQWTDEVPRRIKAAVERALLGGKIAGASPQAIEGFEIAPIGYSLDDTEMLFEGVARATLADGSRIARLFKATFTADGQLTHLKLRSAPPQ